MACNNTGMHLDFNNYITTSSEAGRPIFPKIPFAARYRQKLDDFTF